MIRSTFTTAQVDALERLGWGFFPNGPDEWEWKLFNGDRLVACGGDALWDTHVEEVCR